jgi:3'(2'), 5'-bisphosphate nucleotidase
MQELPKVFTIVGSRSHASPETEAYVEEQRKKYGNVEFVAAGSSLKFCLVAEGKAQVYPRFAPTMEWDTAAGQVIVEQAGGKMVEWPSKNDIKYNRMELRNTWFLCEAKEI